MGIIIGNQIETIELLTSGMVSVLLPRLTKLPGGLRGNSWRLVRFSLEL